MLFKAHFPAQNSHLSRAGIKKLYPRINMGDYRINYGINGLTQGSVGRVHRKGTGCCSAV
jgi:hypothetical protein